MLSLKKVDEKCIIHEAKSRLSFSDGRAGFCIGHVKRTSKKGDFLDVQAILIMHL
jgi:hypothetical protein